MNGATASAKKNRFPRLMNENYLNAPFKDKDRVKALGVGADAKLTQGAGIR